MPRTVSTTNSGRSGFTSTQETQETTAPCRYNTPVINCKPRSEASYRGKFLRNCGFVWLVPCLFCFSAQQRCELFWRKVRRLDGISVFFDRLSMIDVLALIFRNIWSFGSLAQNNTKIKSLFIKIHASNDECLRSLVVVSVTCVQKTENPGLAFNRFNWCRHDFITLCDWGVFCFCTLEFSLVNRKTICEESTSVLEYINVSPPTPSLFQFSIVCRGYVDL